MYGDWTSFDACSVECGKGKQRRTRPCTLVNLASGDVLDEHVDPNECRKVNPGLEPYEIAPCTIREHCEPCRYGTSKLGLFQFEQNKDVVFIDPEKTHANDHSFLKRPFTSIHRYPALTEQSCADACGTHAGCQGFLWFEELCDLIFTMVTFDPTTGDDDTVVNVGQMTTLCGEPFSRDSAIRYKFEWEIKNLGSFSSMEDLINSIRPPAHVWRFLEDGDTTYSLRNNYGSSGNKLIIEVRLFIREKLGGNTERKRKRREAMTVLRQRSGMKEIQLPDDVTPGVISNETVTTEIVTTSGEVIGSCDSDNACSCANGYRLVGESECVDKNECAENETICGEMTAGVCYNTIGSYDCYCHSGYESLENKCMDVNECTLDSTLCSKEGMECLNIAGSFECGCSAGYFEKRNVLNPTHIEECVRPEWSEWSQWTDCTVLVKQSVRQRSCSVAEENLGCVGKDEEIRECRWLEWSDWTDCTLTCAGGNKTRRRSCLYGKPGNLGCEGGEDDVTTCNTEACPPCESNNGGCSDNCASPGNHIDWAMPNYSVTCTCRDEKVIHPADSKTCVSPCDLENGGCTDNCHWTEGSKLFCSCNNEKVLDPTDLHTCVSPCDVRNGGCERHCHWMKGLKRTCSCDSPNVIDPADAQQQTCTLELCEFNMHMCHSHATCTDSLDGPVCECKTPYTGDGFDCTMCPAHDDCWTYNSTTHECSMIPRCSSLICLHDSIKIEMDPLLFGLTEPHAANWASKAVPELSGEKLSFIAPLGDERMHITTSSNEDQIILEVLFAIDGMNRQRSSVRSAEIDLGSFSVYSTNIGISVQYKCTYPTAITVETEEFSVKVISNLGKKEGTGNLANGFQLNISSAKGPIYSHSI